MRWHAKTAVPSFGLLRTQRRRQRCHQDPYIPYRAQHTPLPQPNTRQLRQLNQLNTAQHTPLPVPQVRRRRPPSLPPPLARFLSSPSPLNFQHRVCACVTKPAARDPALARPRTPRPFAPHMRTRMSPSLRTPYRRGPSSAQRPRAPTQPQPGRRIVSGPLRLSHVQRRPGSSHADSQQRRTRLVLCYC
jgi:hypothetical protein